MTRKRSIFEIDFDVSDDGDSDDGAGRFPAGNQRAPETKAYNVQGHPLQNREPAPSRRSPMASAIAETAEASDERARAVAAIRDENDSLAHEFVRLKKLGLITDLIRTADVHTTKLTRDRAQNRDDELEDLKTSIRAVGLSNPIRVEQSEAGYELIQGFRRLSAFRELAEETGDPRYARIPAALVPRGEPLDALYRKMVDENLVRKDLSFGEMAQLAISYAEDTGGSVHDAVSTLYASAAKQKRSYIRQFARVLQVLGGAVRHPEAWPRAFGLELDRAFESEPGRAAATVRALEAIPARDEADEARILRQVLKPVAKAPAAKRSLSKTTLRFERPEGEARLIAHDGKVELRLGRDFSALSKARLQRAADAFLAALAEDAAGE
jgi:ParB family chromosome partitioning protein